MSTRVCAVSFYKLKRLELQSWNRKILITHNHFRQCRVRFSSFLRQSFSKQLYIEQGVHVAEFVKITRDIPKKIVLAGT